ncbi:MAG: protein kinase [Ilumatobacteraceae bacterium]|nr:protein kinase [Ilumatobacteraceae bacterium]
MRFGVLGSVEAKLDDVVVSVGGPQQRRLLALMLSRPGQSISVDRLVECLWPDGLAPDGAPRAVMTYVSRLRGALLESSITTVPGGYQLDLGDSLVDAQQFEELLSAAGIAEPGRAVELYDRALALWRGSPYGEFGGEWWVLTEANRLSELRVVALEERAEALLALGHHHRAIPELGRLTGDHPLRERPVSLLMRALFSTGRRADALRAYQAFRTRLAEETGLDPSDDLVALERSLASGAPVANVSGRARLLRGYAVHEVLGEGAFGRVFAATQPGTNREVAIKSIRPELVDSPEFIQRFEAEAQLVARLEHPHIVPLYDYWREPGGAYLVFRLLTGGTALGALASDGPFSVARVSRVVEEVGSGLLAAHAAGVVHCDIKPSNVLFDETGNAYLSDFGIAVTSWTQSLARDRTRVYGPPELSDRTGDTVQSDIFSFGCMLWELLTGRSPLTLMQTPTSSRLPSLTGLIEERCELLDAVLATATAPRAEARYDSLAEFIVAWRDAVGRPGGVLTPLGSQLAKPDSSRRRAARALSTEVTSTVNPYKGLRAFGEADAADFFGRADVAVALRDTLAAKKFVAVVGPSGSGKSSLVYAGLIPLLRHGGTRVATMVPGDRPTVALGQALREIAATDNSTTNPADWFSGAVGDGAGPIVLIVDQFEECWTLADAAERERFLSTILVAGEFGIRCVATVRADLYDRPLQHGLIGQLVADGTFAVPPLSPQSLEQAIVRPAERYGATFEEGVVTAIVAETNAQPAGLPLLQFAVAEMYERRVDNHITATTFQQLGGLGGAIGRRAEAIYGALSEEMKAHTRQLFGRLVAPGHGTPDTRRRARFGELSEPERAVADRFVEARLLVADRDLATREPVIEVAHEALLSNWPRLREWLEIDRRWLAQLQHLATAARTWDEAGRPDGELYRGSRLEGVLEALPERGDQLNAEERSFVEASRTVRDAVRDRERRTARRLRRLLTTTACLLALALVAGAIAFTQRQNARTAEVSAEQTTLASRLLSLRSSQRDLAALLAVEAWRRSPKVTSKAALFGTFTFDPGFLGYLHFAGANTAAVAIPGMTKLVVTSSKRNGEPGFEPGQVVDVLSGDAGVQLEAIMQGTVVSQWIEVSTSGRVAAAMEEEFGPNGLHRVAAAFDLSTGRKIGRTIELSGTTAWSMVAVDATGAQLAIGADDRGAATVYDTSSGKVVAELPALAYEPHADPGLTGALGYGPDGRLYLGSTADHLRVFDPVTFDMVADIKVPDDSTGGLMKFSPDGGTLVARGRIRDPLTDAPRISIARIDLPTRSVVWSINGSDEGISECGEWTFSLAMDRLWCGTNFGVIHERSLATGEITGRTIESQRGSSQSLELMDVGGASILVVVDGEAGLIGRWRVDGGGPIQRLVAAGRVLISAQADSKTVLVGKPNGGVPPFDLDYALWDTASDTLTQALPDIVWGGGQGNIIYGAFSDGTIGTYNVTTKQRRSFGYPLNRDDMPSAKNISRDGALLLLGYSDGHVVELDVATGETVVRFSGDGRQVEHVVITDDHSRIYVSGQGLYALNATTGEVVASSNNRSLGNVAISPQGVLVASAHDGGIGIYEPDTLVQTASLAGARGFVSQLRFSEDGNVLLASGDDGTLSMYDVRTRVRLGDAAPVGRPGTNAPVDLREDGVEAVIPSLRVDGAAVWDLNPEHWVTAACSVARRNLTRDEWSTYIGDLGGYRATCPEFPAPPGTP